MSAEAQLQPATRPAAVEASQAEAELLTAAGGAVAAAVVDITKHSDFAQNLINPDRTKKTAGSRLSINRLPPIYVHGTQ